MEENSELRKHIAEIEKLEVQGLLKNKLEHFLTYLAPNRRNLFVETMALLPKERQEAFIEFIEEKQVINDKKAMLVLFGELNRFNTIADAVEALEQGNEVIRQGIQETLQAFAETVCEKLIGSAEASLKRLEGVEIKLESCLERLMRAIEDSEAYANKMIGYGDSQLAVVKKFYEEREVEENKKHASKMKEVLGLIDAINKKIEHAESEAKVVYSKLAVKSIKETVVREVMKALYVRGALVIFGLVVFSHYAVKIVDRLLGI